MRGASFFGLFWLLAKRPDQFARLLYQVRLLFRCVPLTHGEDIDGAHSGNAADVNPIGAISKTDLKKFIAYARDAFDLPVLTEYVHHILKVSSHAEKSSVGDTGSSTLFPPRNLSQSRRPTYRPTR